MGKIFFRRSQETVRRDLLSGFFCLTLVGGQRGFLGPFLVISPDVTTRVFVVGAACAEVIYHFSQRVENHLFVQKIVKIVEGVVVEKIAGVFPGVVGVVFAPAVGVYAPKDLI